MRGKVKMLFLAILMVAMAGAAQADTIFPVGYTLNYSATAGSDSWTSTLSFTSTTTMKMIDWDNVGQEAYPEVLLTSDTFSINLGAGLQPFFKKLAVNDSWTFTGDDADHETVKATVMDILTDFTVKAGTFDNVYWVKYEGGLGHMDENMYWKPGLGLIYAVDSGLSPTTIHELTSYATPLPPGVWLLGSGLVGLLGLRRFRRS